jgi:hypothetical protein
MNEQTLQFGPDNALVGTLASTDKPHAGLGALLFNAGVVPRIGPNRLNVRITRALAGHGIPAMRFDLSGRGDSAPARGMESYEQQAIADLRAAMDLMTQRTGVRRFALMGLCSGAENAFHAALADERVVGITLLDSYHFPTWRTSLNRFRQRARLQGGVVPATFAWLMRRLRPHASGHRHAPAVKHESSAATSFGSIRPTPAEFAARLKQLLDRGVAVDLLFSGSFVETYNYANQFRDVFGRYGIVDRMKVEYQPDLDHTLSTAIMQQSMVARTLRWFGEVAAH